MPNPRFRHNHKGVVFAFDNCLNISPHDQELISNVDLRIGAGQKHNPLITDYEVRDHSRSLGWTISYIKPKAGSNLAGHAGEASKSA